MRKNKELLIAIMEKASENEEFRKRLLSDAKSAISSDFEFTVPDSVNIVVHENDAGTVHLPVPPAPKVLGEGQLAQVSGGECGGCYNCNHCFNCI